jgi:hypothetical protein
MNLKAAYYAFSRMLLPTITVIVLAMMWTLSPTETFGFLVSKSNWAAFLRIVLLLAELAWFYYLYQKYINTQLIEEEIKKDKWDKSSYSVSYLADRIKSLYNINYSTQDNTIKIKIVGDIILIKKA